MSTDLSLFANRELSWLEFNTRVLDMARRESLPLLERLKFVAIAASNLDEFYMVRVANLRAQMGGKSSHEPSPDGRRPGEVLRDVAGRASQMCTDIAALTTDQILPALSRRGVRVLDAGALSPDQRAEASAYYQREVHPCLTPIAIDPSHPFPQLRNRSLNLALRIEPKPRARGGAIEQPEGLLFAIVQVPSVLPRFVPIACPDALYGFLPLEAVVAMHAQELFPGHKIIESCPFRVTRSSDLELVEEEAENLLTTIQDQLRRRDRREAVRLELSSSSSEELVAGLAEMIELEPLHIHRVPGLVAVGDLMAVYAAADVPELKDEPWSPVPSPALRYARSVFARLDEGDVLLHHPYESFGHVLELLDAAADDPDVVAIKMTLYRTSGDSPIVRALARAAERGKQVTAVVELKARFDEAANIHWARALDEGGVHVVYGLIGLKVHAKMALVIRRCGDELKRYLHIATGNYNPSTARFYTDLGLLTAREDITADAMLLFNVLTGYGDLPPLSRLIVSPFRMRQHFTELIAREAEHARAGRGGRIIAKFNSLVDPGIVRALYRASQAGVEIDLLVRGMCVLRPGLPGISETIRVRAIVDRFLEHARIYYWGNGGQEEVYLSSADWMPRNLNRRIEIAFPVLDPALRRRIKDEILATELADTASSWTIGPDGAYTRVSSGEARPTRAQQVFMTLARERSVPPRAAVRRELAARSASTPSGPVLPAVRAAEAQAARRNKPRA